MARLSEWTWLAPLLVAALVPFGLIGCASTAAMPTPAAQSDELAALRLQVVAQSTRIAALETRVSLPAPTAAQATPKPAAPTPTMVPAVAGLIVDGTTKGSAAAKVTITEYLDYL